MEHKFKAQRTHTDYRKMATLLDWELPLRGTQLPPDRPSGQVKLARPGSTERHGITPRPVRRPEFGTIFGHVTCYNQIWLAKTPCCPTRQVNPARARTDVRMKTNRHIFKYLLKFSLKFSIFNVALFEYDLNNSLELKDLFQISHIIFST